MVDLGTLVRRAEVDGPDRMPQIVEVTDDRLALRIPLGPEDADNYIVGACLAVTAPSSTCLPFYDTWRTSDSLPKDALRCHKLPWNHH